MSAKPTLLRQLILAFIPVAVWLFLFSNGVKLLPESIKPSINVELPPVVDSALFYNSHSWFASNTTHPLLDVLAAVPYTIHSSIPAIYLAISALVPERRQHFPRFVCGFGLMNLAAVNTHLFFPTAPPWYFIKYGVQPANYSIRGDSAGLDVLDKRYNMTMFENMYGEMSSIVFGTWPSLHAAWPYYLARFNPGFGRRGTIFLFAYTLLVWWAAIYLEHHYAFDLLGGAFYAELALWLLSPDRRRKIDYLPFVRADITPEVLAHSKKQTDD